MVQRDDYTHPPTPIWCKLCPRWSREGLTTFYPLAMSQVHQRPRCQRAMGTSNPLVTVRRISARISVVRSRASNVLPPKRRKNGQKVRQAPLRPGDDIDRRRPLIGADECPETEMVRFRTAFYDAYWRLLHAVSLIPTWPDVEADVLEGVRIFFTQFPKTPSLTVLVAIASGTTRRIWTPRGPTPLRTVITPMTRPSGCTICTTAFGRARGDQHPPCPLDRCAPPTRPR